MLQVTTYQIKPYLLIGETPEKYVKPGTEWIRDTIKGLMHVKSEQLKQKGVDTSLFHNHNEANSNTLPAYPKIIYHHTNGQFLVTGINEGAFALHQLFTIYRNTIEINDQLKIGINRFSEEEIVISETLQPIMYQIHNYLALDSKTHKQYVEVPMTEKISMIEKTLHKHLTNDLFKYMGVSLPDIQVQVMDILKLDQKLLPYKAHFYLPFNLLFSLNANLPRYVALGSGKAFGYGIIEKYWKEV
jgi:hypothetical protein